MLRTNCTTPDPHRSSPPATAQFDHGGEHPTRVRTQSPRPAELAADDGFLDNGGRLFCDPLAY